MGLFDEKGSRAVGLDLGLQKYFFFLDSLKQNTYLPIFVVSCRKEYLYQGDFGEANPNINFIHEWLAIAKMTSCILAKKKPPSSCEAEA